MKGEPKEPRCGFSNFVVQTLKFYSKYEFVLPSKIEINHWLIDRSRLWLSILNELILIYVAFPLEIKDYKSIDVLKYEVIRKQAKAYSNWPTFPQLYVDGKLIGGSDIVSEMHKDGSLKELFL